MTDQMIAAGVLEKHNAERLAALQSDYDHLGEQLDRRGIAIDAIKARVAKYTVAVPSWGVGTGGTRFAKFPGAGEPRNIFDKIEDCAVINELTRATPSVSLHIPWDKTDPNRLKQAGRHARADVRRHELQHLLGRAGPEAELQVRLAQFL